MARKDDLQDEARELGITGFSTMNVAELEAAIAEAKGSDDAGSEQLPAEPTGEFTGHDVAAADQLAAGLGMDRTVALAYVQQHPLEDGEDLQHHVNRLRSELEPQEDEHPINSGDASFQASELDLSDDSVEAARAYLAGV